MGIISINQVTTGMTLKSDLLTPEGRLLLPGGSEVSHAVLRACRIWGITEADIEGQGEAETAVSESFDTLDPQLVFACKSIASRRLKFCNPRHPAVKEIARKYVVRAARTLKKDEARRILTHYTSKEERPELRPGPTVQEILTRGDELASLPDIFFQISEALKHPRSSAAYMADVIGRDVSLSAKLLRLVNTPFYGFPGTIDTLPRAVTIVGTDQLSNLALGVSVIEAFAGVPQELFDLRSFWKHSILCGIIARLLSSRIKNGNEERMFVAGLLHDIGRLIMAKNFPELTRTAFDLGRADRIPMRDAELKAWGFCHTDLGAALLKNWKLPAEIISLVQHHHTPGSAPYHEEASIIHVADFMSVGIGFGTSGNMYVPELAPNAWRHLKISHHDMSSDLDQALNLTDNILDIFLSAPGSE